MPDKNFTDADSAAKYAENLRTLHQYRDASIMSGQALWELPVQKTPTDRTIFRSTEPWRATRLIMSFLGGANLRFKATLPPDLNNKAKKERDSMIDSVERLMRAHMRMTDFRFRQERRATFRRAWSLFAAVYGWTAGINIVKDNAKDGEWPLYTDLWSPLDTYPDMRRGKTALVHYSSMTADDIISSFGSNRIGGKLPGYNFERVNDDEDYEYLVAEYWDSDTNAIWVQDQQNPRWLKEQMEHKLGMNPAWCDPIDGVPFTHSVVGRDGSMLKTPDSTSGRWLEFVGQSPIKGYEIPYRVLVERVNQVGDVAERWANPKVIARTQDGKHVTFDPTDPEPMVVPIGTDINTLIIPSFPGDQRAFIEYMEKEIAKSSFADVLYGLLGSMEAASAMEIARQSADPIIAPMAEQLEDKIEDMALSFLRQLEAAPGRKKAKSLIAKSMDTKGKRFYDVIDLSTIPNGIYVAAELRGAGPRESKAALASVASNLANARNPIYDLETLHDEILDTDNPPEIVNKLFWQRMTSSEEVDKRAAPATTLLHWADKLRAQGGDRGKQLAEIYESLAVGAIEELIGAVMLNKLQLKQAMSGGESAAPGGGGAALGGEAQVEGVAPPGAPPAGVAAAPTGPAPERGAQMMAAAQGAEPPI